MPWFSCRSSCGQFGPSEERCRRTAFVAFLNFTAKAVRSSRRVRPNPARHRTLVACSCLGRIIRKLSWCELSFLLLTKISRKMTGLNIGFMQGSSFRSLSHPRRFSTRWLRIPKFLNTSISLNSTSLLRGSGLVLVRSQLPAGPAEVGT